MTIRSSWGSAAAIVMMSLPAMASVAAAQQPSLPSRPMLTASDAITGFVTEASQRFGVPDTWIRAVMQVESAGDSNSTSSAGAMGLMQVMPQTYAMLRARLGLGASPYDPHDNIMAGAAYLREMHDRYGSTGFLAAYNAGPGRFDEFARVFDRCPQRLSNTWRDSIRCLALRDRRRWWAQLRKQRARLKRRRSLSS